MGCSINIGCISECIDEEIMVMFTLNALGPIIMEITESETYRKSELEKS